MVGGLGEARHDALETMRACHAALPPATNDRKV
jgi:hypothetical protein